MDIRTFAKLLLRLLSIYVFARGLTILPGLLDVAIEGPPEGGIGYSTLLMILAGVSPFVVGAILWALAPMIATWAVGASETGAALPSSTADAVQVIAFVTLGVFFVVNGVPHVAGIIYAAIYNKEAGYMIVRGEDFFAAIAETVLGVVLALGARYITELVRRFSFPRQHH